MDKDFAIWLFNNFRKDENDLFYHKKDHQYVKDRYTFEKLKEIFLSKKQ